MMFFHLPSSSGALFSYKDLVPLFARTAKPRRMACSLDLKDGLRAALAGKITRDNSIDIFYLH
jgi:hypothetical protein